MKMSATFIFFKRSPPSLLAWQHLTPAWQQPFHNLANDWNCYGHIIEPALRSVLPLQCFPPPRFFCKPTSSICEGLSRTRRQSTTTDESARLISTWWTRSRFKWSQLSPKPSIWSKWDKRDKVENLCKFGKFWYLAARRVQLSSKLAWANIIQLSWKPNLAFTHTQTGWPPSWF